MVSGKKYVGLTESLPEDRLKQHNAGSNVWSKGHKPFELIYTETFSDKQSARKRELFFKTGQGKNTLDNLLK